MTSPPTCNRHPIQSRRATDSTLLRPTSIDVSGIEHFNSKPRRSINLSIGQPDFPVPADQDAAINAIETDRNGYTLTAGHPDLLNAIKTQLQEEIGWTIDGQQLDVMVTSGTSGALLLSFMAMLDPGDEVIVADPYFVVYTALGPMTGSTVRLCDTYPDFRLTAQRVEPLITDRTKIVLVNSPATPPASSSRYRDEGTGRTLRAAWDS